MSPRTRSHTMMAGVLILAAALILPACSDDDGPTAPPGDDSIPNTPDIPVVGNPQDALPGTSDFLALESAVLANFSPDLSGATAAMLDPLNASPVMEFRLPPGRNVLFAEGRPCYPEHLQWTTGAVWWDLERATSAPPLTYLGDYQGSHYYLCTGLNYWYFADVSCRSFGGHLAALTTPGESAFVVSAVQAQIPGAAFHIGLTDWARANGDWMWTSGEPYDWFHWYPGEPNNADGAEEFVHVLANGQWNDGPSAYTVGWVLERDLPLTETDVDEVPCARAASQNLYLDGLAAPTVTPHIERRVYWQKVFQVAIGSGATYSEEHSYTHGTSETTGMSFGWSIGISTSLGWGPLSVEIETEFHQDFNHEVTVNDEETFTKTYTATAPEGKTMLLALWQLRERYCIVDVEGNDWSDPRFELSGPLPYLDQGLQQEYIQTLLFD